MAFADNVPGFNRLSRISEALALSGPALPMSQQDALRMTLRGLTRAGSGNVQQPGGAVAGANPSQPRQPAGAAAGANPSQPRQPGGAVAGANPSQPRQPGGAVAGANPGMSRMSPEEIRRLMEQLQAMMGARDGALRAPGRRPIDPAMRGAQAGAGRGALAGAEQGGFQQIIEQAGRGARAGAGRGALAGAEQGGFQQIMEQLQAMRGGQAGAEQGAPAADPLSRRRAERGRIGQTLGRFRR